MGNLTVWFEFIFMSKLGDCTFISLPCYDYELPRNSHEERKMSIPHVIPPSATWMTSVTQMKIWLRTVGLVVACLKLFIPLENFSLIWRHHHYRWRVSNLDLYSALMAIEQWGFYSVAHLLWHGSSIFNGHLRGPVTISPVAERLAVELSQHV